MNTKTANRARARRRWLLALTIFVLSGVLAGDRASAQQPPGSDFALRQAVERQLLLDLPRRANRIAIVVDDGVVELRGEVDNLLARQRTERVVERLRIK